MFLADPGTLRQQPSSPWLGRQTLSRAVSGASFRGCEGEVFFCHLSRKCFVLCCLTLGSLCRLWDSCFGIGVEVFVTVCFMSVYFTSAELRDVVFKLRNPSTLPARAWPA